MIFLPAVPHEVDVIKSPGQRASIGPVRSIKPFDPLPVEECAWSKRSGFASA